IVPQKNSTKNDTTKIGCKTDSSQLQTQEKNKTPNTVDSGDFRDKPMRKTGIKLNSNQAKFQSTPAASSMN
ncbi:MAG: hypothetical protein LBT05_08905, partial [Planctomycetaceae bacterium]|nr:hypothetical protein [Planctomycetaceae bacterium]